MLGASLDITELNLKDALNVLNGLEVLILYSRFVTRMTLDDLAERLTTMLDCGNYDTESPVCPKLEDFPSITRERVRQLETKALLKLKRYFVKYNGNVVIPYLISKNEYFIRRETA